MLPGDICRSDLAGAAARIGSVATRLETEVGLGHLCNRFSRLLMGGLLMVLVHDLSRPFGFHPMLDNRLIIFPFPELGLQINYRILNTYTSAWFIGFPILGSGFGLRVTTAAVQGFATWSFENFGSMIALQTTNPKTPRAP